MRIEMNRKINVAAYEVLATLAFPEDRTEVLSLLQMAQEYGSLTGEQVVDPRNGLLPGRPRVMGSRLLNMAAELELLEVGRGGRYTISEFGQETLANETVFVPEEASWTIWVTDDPLFPTNVLYVERHREGRSDRDRVGVRTMPSYITGISDSSVELLRPHHTDSTELRVKEIKEKGRLSNAKSDLNLIVIADHGQETVARIRGSIGTGKGNQVDQRIQFDGPTHEVLFANLLDQSEFGLDWKQAEGMLEVGFDELTPSERENHFKTIRIDEPDLDELGSFNAVELKSIPLSPRTGHDARQWAEWEFWSEFQDHPWSDLISSKWNIISNRFELLAHGMSNPPSVSNRIDELRSIPVQELSPSALSQLRKCQAISDLGGESA